MFLFFLKKSMYKHYKIIILLAVQRHHYECFGKSIISCLEKFSFFLRAIYFYVISSTRYSGSTGLSAANIKYIYVYIYTHT